jgi:hypothetical protein
MMIIGFVAVPGEANVIKSNASGKNICSKLVIVTGIIAALMISSNLSAFAETETVKGSAQGTALTANFSFDGVTPASSIISTGKDNIGGKFNAQDVSEYAFTATSCTAPDGTAGTAFVLVQGKEVRTYKKGQLYTSGTAAADNSGCQSNTTGSFGLTETHSVIGGTGEFANAFRFDHPDGYRYRTRCTRKPPRKTGIVLWFQVYHERISNFLKWFGALNSHPELT